VVLLLSRPSTPHAATAPSSAPAAPVATAPVTVHATPAPPTPSPFLSARTQFVATLAPASPASSTNDAIAPVPTGSAPASAAPPADPAPIPTANVNSLPPAGADTSASAPSPHAPAVRAAAAQPPPPPVVAAASGGTGTLKVICFPGCDQVVDNGASLGPSPIVRKNASLGSHRVKLVWSDTTKVVSTVVIADQTATVRENHP
jgi:eukaryotic-like serine/threonine-protein kinase